MLLVHIGSLSRCALQRVSGPEDDVVLQRCSVHVIFASKVLPDGPHCEPKVLRATCEASPRFGRFLSCHRLFRRCFVWL